MPRSRALTPAAGPDHPRRARTRRPRASTSHGRSSAKPPCGRTTQPQPPPSPFAPPLPVSLALVTPPDALAPPLPVSPVPLTEPPLIEPPLADALPSPLPL